MLGSAVRPAAILVLFLSLLGAPALAQPAIPQSLTWGPAPDHVVDVEMTSPEDARFDATSGIRFLLSDNQSDHRGDESILYIRFAMQAATQAGLAGVSQLEIPYEPEDSALVFHHIRVLRNGVWEDRSERIRTTFAQREPFLEYGLLTGQISAIVRIGDVRVDDVVDIAYSLRNSTARLGGRPAQIAFPGAITPPIETLHFRSVWPRGGVVWDAVPEIGEVRHEVTRRAEVFERPAGPYEAPEMEANLPQGVAVGTTLSLSGFRDWADVVAWAQPYYMLDAEPDPELVSIAADIRNAHDTDADRALAALRFVQDEIQYFALLMGEGGYTPQTVSDTLFNRSGDCKAKVALLLALFAQLGLDGAPVFVNATGAGPLIGQFPANPLIFNHVIVRLELAGETFWMDPTLAFQGGTLATQFIPQYGMGLVIDEGVEAPVSLPLSGSEEVLTRIEEHFDMTDQSSVSVRLELRFSGIDADLMRAMLAQTGESQFETAYEGIYDSRFGGARISEPISITDERETNRIEIALAVGLDDPFELDEDENTLELNLNAHMMPDVLPRIADPEERASPVGVVHPTHARHRIRVDMPWVGDPQSYDLEDHEIETEAFTYRLNRSMLGNVLVLDHTVRSLTDRVDAGAVARTYEARGEMRDHYRYNIFFPAGDRSDDQAGK